MTPVIDLSDPRPRSRAWQILAVWTSAALVYGVVLHAQLRVPIDHALVTASVYFYTLALLMMPAGRLAARFAATRWRGMRLLAPHLLMGIGVVATWQLVFAGFMRVTIGPQYWKIVFEESWMFQLVTAAMAYGAALGITLTLQAADRERARERREAEQHLATREAELTAIKAQLQPHFLFNALNSILALIDSNPSQARAMVARLADLLHAVFDRMDAAEIPLERELDLVRAYLDIEHVRFGPRLTIAVEVDADARRSLVPPFLLQPLVENAIKHGIAPKRGGGEVRIQARVAGDRLHIHVQDSGDAGPARAAAGNGHGLLLTRRRLDNLYGTGYRLALEPNPRGFAVTLDLPAALRAH